MEIINDFYTSLKKSFSEVDHEWESYPGLVVAGTHSPRDIEITLKKICEARENNLPFLGICAGMQMMVIEYARNVLGIADATSAEFEATGKVVVEKLPKLRVGAIRVIDAATGADRQESHWHNYAVTQEFFMFLDNRMLINESSQDGIAEGVVLPDHRFFYGVQYHPEYQSSREKPHPVLREFLKSCAYV